jgi:pyruvate/2-oxoglutarate dehydrogenase complex dihydrolipoamide acyltransferase (E2) component
VCSLVGDYAKEEEVVCELETEKITVSVKAPVSGTVTKHLFEEGQDVRKGEPLFEMVCSLPSLSFATLIAFCL